MKPCGENLPVIDERKIMNNSWRTTTLGIVTILTAVLNGAKALLDGDLSTVPEVGSIITAVTAGIGLICARDHKVTSEEAGAKQ